MRFCRLRFRHQASRNITMQTSAIPANVPPTMGPTLTPSTSSDGLLLDELVGKIDVVTFEAEVEVEEDVDE